MLRQLEYLAHELPITATLSRHGPLEWWTFHSRECQLVIRLHFGKRYVRGDLPLYYRHLGRFSAQFERHTLSINQPSFESPRS